MLVLASCSTQNPEADLVSSWEVTFEHETGSRGASPELVAVDGVTTLIVTSLDRDKYWTSDDGVVFEKTSVQMPPGADYTVIEQPDGPGGSTSQILSEILRPRLPPPTI